MLTETRRLKIGCVVFALALSFNLCAQDSVSTKPFQRYWTKPRLVPKIGGGVQETAFIEAGIQLHKIYVHPLSLASAGPYLTVDVVLREDRWIAGPKIGYEIAAGLFALAADVTYYTDFSEESLVFTPHAGVSILGFVNLFYGRNIPLSDFRFKAIDTNRFSLIFNLNRDYFDLRNAPRR